MCWVGVDRAIKMAQALGESEPLDEWRGLRDEIRGDVLERGFDRELGTFVQAYSSRSLDASAMLLPLVGFIRADDPKMISTVAAIQERLPTDGLVHRYRRNGLPGEEGAFAICSFWLVGNLALQGRADEARALFERVCSLANDVGLLAEEIDPRTRETARQLSPGLHPRRAHQRRFPSPANDEQQVGHSTLVDRWGRLQDPS
jgi:GH15 family glucan-1,4-alpha-glucosidase